MPGFDASANPAGFSEGALEGGWKMELVVCSRRARMVGLGLNPSVETETNREGLPLRNACAAAS
jgi:hypothetical protein